MAPVADRASTEGENAARNVLIDHYLRYVEQPPPITSKNSHYFYALSPSCEIRSALLSTLAPIAYTCIEA